VSSPGPNETSTLAAERERQARVFETVLSHIADFAYAFDRDGRFTYVNKPLLDLWGLTLEQAVGKNFFELNYPPELARRLQRQIQQVIDTKQGLSDETPYTSPTGVSGYYEYIFSPVFAPDGSVELVAGSTRDVTERRKAADALRAGEDRYRSFIRLSSEGIWRFELEVPVRVDLPVDEQVALFFRHAYLAECNDAMARMYGFASAADIVGRRLPEFHDAHDPRSLEFLRAFVLGGYRLQDAESVEPDRQGNPRVFMNSFVGAVEGGRLLRAWGTQRDVTEQKRAEATLRQSEAHFRFLSELAERTRDLADPERVLAAVARALGEHLEVSRCAYADVEADAEHFTIRHDYTDGCASTAGNYRLSPFGPRAAADQRAGRTLVVHDVDAELSPDEGADMFNAIGIKAIVCCPHVRGGRLVAMMAVHQTTPRRWTPEEVGLVEAVVERSWAYIERARAEAALRQSEQRLSAILDNAPAMVYVIDADGRFLYVNGRWEPVLGLTNERVAGRSLHEFFPRWVADQFAENNRRVLEGRAPVGSEEVVPQADGPHSYISVKVPLFDAAGRPYAVCGISTDITERKRAEGERERLLATERATRAEAERANEAKNEFLATLSHELRTPLTPVLLAASLMENHPGLPDDLREDVATIRRNVELESRLISDLLDLTRIERGKLKLEEQEVDLHLIVRSAVDICQREASARLTVSLKAARHTVRGDATRLQQVFWNLINNAIKFTGPDGTITVRSADAPGGRVRVEVADTGAGIDPAILPRLFNAFEQGEARAGRQQAGLGLGLAISKRLAEAHGGTIAAHSEGRGRGATFTVELPAQAPPAAADSHYPPAQSEASPRQLNVLLVEDHESTLQVLSKLLRRLGHRVTGVSTAASATAAAKGNGFDVIISDLGLPDGSGLDVMRQVREKYAGRAIALTGYGMESDVAASREAGFAEHLTKPVDLNKLQDAIARVTDTTPPQPQTD